MHFFFVAFLLCDDLVVHDGHNHVCRFNYHQRPRIESDDEPSEATIMLKSVPDFSVVADYFDQSRHVEFLLAFVILLAVAVL